MIKGTFMNKNSLHLSIKAKTSLNEIINYTRKQWGQKEFQHLKRRLNDLIEIIQSNPYAFKTYDGNEQVRQALLLTNISVFYMVNDSSIHILLFWDNRRDPDTLNL